MILQDEPGSQSGNSGGKDIPYGIIAAAAAIGASITGYLTLVGQLSHDIILLAFYCTLFLLTSKLVGGTFASISFRFNILYRSSLCMIPESSESLLFAGEADRWRGCLSCIRQL